MIKHRIFVFANLKPSQIDYKIIPLSHSSKVEHVYVLRKEPLNLNNPKITCLNLPWVLRQRPIYWFATAFYGIYKIKKHKTNIILSYNIFPHGFNAFIASKLTKQPALFSEINEDTIKFYPKVIAHILIKKILSNARIICTPGSNIAKFWNNNGFLNTTILHSTIDTNKFTPNKSFSKSYDFIFIGTLDNNKRPDLIINAFSIIQQKHKEANLCIIGFGDLEEIIKKQIINLKLEHNIHFVKTNNVLEYIQRSKIFLMASLSEGIPCAMMEAMSCELIVVVPPVGDISDVINHSENGFLHDNSKEDILKWMLESYLNYEKLTSIMTKARETIINNHSFESATIKWNELLKKI